MKTISKILILAGLCFALSSASAQVSVGISVRLAPPELPVYVQPECPVDGYIWQPGYWAYNDGDGYYWVPGVWVAPPNPGYYWTPTYWGYDNGHYGFHAGYWGPHVGFYGGINYGYGYGGYGYGGGRWVGNRFSYNTAVVHVNRTVIHNTYIDRTVIRNTYVHNRVSFNGPHGVNARPRPEEQSAMRERHVQPTQQQLSHQEAAGRDRRQFAKINHGRPAAASLDKVSGRPFNVRGRHVAHGTAFGQPAVKNAPTAHNNPGRPANAERHGAGAPAHNQPQQPHAQPQGAQHGQPQMHMRLQPHQRAKNVEQPQQQPQPQHNQPQQPRPQPQHNEPRPQPQHNQPRPQPQHNEPRPQPQHNQPRPQPQHNEPRPQPQHNQPRPQPQQHQQPHNNPRPGGGGRPHHG